MSPVEREGVRLLDPTQDAWRDHFTLSDDRLWAEDLNAAYTHQVYQLDDPRKVVRRRARRELINDRLEILSLLAELPELLQLADTARRQDLARFGEILREIQRIRDDSRRALQDLERYRAIPTDAPTSCRCGTTSQHSLPVELEEQLLEIP